ncbi:MAG: mannose-6-phosphate isomerase [Sphingorhabdus sp.]|nr:mannose-6-phosphate isomerase [Sphingorhabdus sp.]
MKLITKMVEKPWGRDDIAAAFAAPPGQRIGEIWFDSDKEPLPLLVKWLFTSDKLSVQVHPNDVQAQERGLVSGKEECWYIIDAQPGARLGIGLKSAIDANTLRTASLSGEIEQMIDWKPVQPGDYYYIPAGTVHAIGAGITLVEIQQNADITYRLYDYGRLDNGALRPLHLDDAVAVSKPQPYTDRRSGHAPAAQMLVAGPLFRLWLTDSAASLPQLGDDEKCWIIPIAGTVNIAAETANVGDCLYVSGGSNITLSADARILVAAGPAK